jgi:hypothetical protein
MGVNLPVVACRQKEPILNDVKMFLMQEQKLFQSIHLHATKFTVMTIQFSQERNLTLLTLNNQFSHMNSESEHDNQGKICMQTFMTS